MSRNAQEKWPTFFRECSPAVSEVALSRLERKFRWGFKMKLRHRGSLGQLIHAYAADYANHHMKRNAELWDYAKPMFEYAVDQGWPSKLSDFVAEKAHRKLMAEQAKQEREAARDKRSESIEKRREQIARLDRKIKSLTTRRQSAQRSLKALERAQEKAREASKARPTQEQTTADEVAGDEVQADC